jgi:lauroyl/myristoyl acyltransferase
VPLNQFSKGFLRTAVQVFPKQIHVVDIAHSLRIGRSPKELDNNVSPLHLARTQMAHNDCIWLWTFLLSARRMAVSNTTLIEGTAPETSTRSEVIPPPSKGPKLWLLGIVYVAIVVGHVLIWLAGRLSRANARRLAGWITQRLEPLTRRRRHANLRMFFGSSGSAGEDLKRVDEAHLRYLARMRADIAQYFWKTPAQLRADVLLEGEDHLRQALALGRGALLVSGHTATWWLVPAVLGVMGYPVTVIFTPIRFKSIERKLLRLAQKYNVRVAFVGRDALKAVRRAAQRNEIIYISFDVAVRAKETETLPFGNGWLQLNPGPAVLAARNSMPALQAACVHHDDVGTRVSLYPADARETDPQQFSPPELCRLWLQRLEDEVRAHPEQWWPWGYVDILDNRRDA